MGQLVDDGWGNLIPIEDSGATFYDLNGNVLDISTFNPIEEDGWGTYSNGLTNTQKTDVKTTYETAKATGDKKLEAIMTNVFKYGKAALDILVTTGVIKDSRAPIVSYNIDTTKYDDTVAQVQKKVSTGTNSGTNQPTNSTYFGIDFSSPLVWIIIVVIVVLIFVMSHSSTQPQTVYLPQTTKK